MAVVCVHFAQLKFFSDQHHLYRRGILPGDVYFFSFQFSFFFIIVVVRSFATWLKVRLSECVPLVCAVHVQKPFMFVWCLNERMNNKSADCNKIKYTRIANTHTHTHSRFNWKEKTNKGSRGVPYSCKLCRVYSTDLARWRWFRVNFFDFFSLFAICRVSYIIIIIFFLSHSCKFVRWHKLFSYFIMMMSVLCVRVHQYCV